MAGEKQAKCNIRVKNERGQREVGEGENTINSRYGRALIWRKEGTSLLQQVLEQVSR